MREKRANTVPRWEAGAGRRAAARLAHPVFRLLNRPGMAWFGRAAYDFALRCNGIAINFPGRRGLTAGEEAFLRRIGPGLGGGTALDVGAHGGAYAAELRRVAPAARILAFEPHPLTRPALERRCAPLGIEVVPLALGDRDGAATLHDFAGAEGTTQASLSPAAVGLYAGEATGHPVEVETLDGFLARRGIAEVAFLKVDTEGHDLRVLHGAREAIRARRLRLIQFEFVGANIATGATMRGFYDALPGYRIARLCLNGAEMPLGPYDVRRCEIFASQNLIARPE